MNIRLCNAACLHGMMSHLHYSVNENVHKSSSINGVVLFHAQQRKVQIQASSIAASLVHPKMSSLSKCLSENVITQPVPRSGPQCRRTHDTCVCIVIPLSSRADCCPYTTIKLGLFTTTDRHRGTYRTLSKHASTMKVCLPSADTHEMLLLISGN